MLGDLGRGQPGDHGVATGAGVRAPGVPGKLLQFFGVHPLLALLGEIHVHVGAHRLEHVDGRAEPDAVLFSVGAGERGILEALRADSDDELARGVGPL